MDKPDDIPFGYCQCGCGGLAPIAKANDKANNCIKGQPKRYIRHHQNKGKGGRIIRRDDRILILLPDHHRANSQGYVFEHILVAEKMLGRPLTLEEVIHHVDGNPGNNAVENLVVCKNNAEHLSLHKQERALEACGHSDWLKCFFCKEYDAPENLVLVGTRAHHRTCSTEYQRKRRAKK